MSGSQLRGLFFVSELEDEPWVRPSYEEPKHKQYNKVRLEVFSEPPLLRPPPSSITCREDRRENARLRVTYVAGIYKIYICGQSCILGGWGYVSVNTRVVRIPSLVDLVSRQSLNSG